MPPALGQSVPAGAGLWLAASGQAGPEFSKFIDSLYVFFVI